MKNFSLSLTRPLLFISLALSLMAISACGQKGPLEVDRPPVTQNQELENTGDEKIDDVSEQD